MSNSEDSEDLELLLEKFRQYNINPTDEEIFTLEDKIQFGIDDIISKKKFISTTDYGTNKVEITQKLKQSKYNLNQDYKT